MVATLSTMQTLGTSMPDFALPDVRADDQLVNNEQFAGKPVLVMFICNHCPYVIHIIESLTTLANDYQQRGCAAVAISSNDVEAYPQDGPAAMRTFAEHYRFEFPYCYDETQQTAIEFSAACTPDFFVYDRLHKLVYRGQFDVSRPGNPAPVSGDELRAALEAVINDQAPSPHQVPSIGCNIKWKPGAPGV